MPRMFGWLSAATALASRSKRASASGCAANSSGRTLTATSRSSFESRARYTSPMPPAPSGEKISYRPSRVPAGSDTALLQAFDHEEIRQQAGVAVGVSASVGADDDVRDSLDAGRIDGQELLPDLAPARRDFDTGDARGNLAPCPGEDRSPVRREAQGEFSARDAGDRARRSPVDRKEHRLVIG